MSKQKTSKRQSDDMQLRQLHRLFGWSSLLLWLIFGTCLEIFHGFKISDYLLDELRREFWSLAHFHGVAFGIINLIYVKWADAEELSSCERKLASQLLIWGGLLMPVGFLLGGAWHFEGDPGVGIFLAPIGAIMVLGLAGLQTRAAWKGFRQKR